MSEAEDERLGRLLRRIRRELSVTQEQLAELSGVPVEDICEIERGRIANVRVGRLRRVFAALDGRLYLNPWWKGAAADRLLDEEHAVLVERATAVLSRRGWRTALEVTFSEYGERGSIDLLGSHERLQAAAICEVKSAFGSLEDTNRSVDTKVRLAPVLCRKRFGWTPQHVGRLLIVRDEPINRRVVNDHLETMNSIYPERSRVVRAWLRKPDRAISGIWFLTIPAGSGIGAAKQR